MQQFKSQIYGDTIQNVVIEKKAPKQGFQLTFSKFETFQILTKGHHPFWFIPLDEFLHKLHYHHHLIILQQNPHLFIDRLFSSHGGGTHGPSLAFVRVLVRESGMVKLKLLAKKIVQRKTCV